MTFSCDRCKTEFEEAFGDTNQADGCSTTVRMSNGILSTFSCFGSVFDCSSYCSERLADATMKKRYAWVKGNDFATNLCDSCMGDMIRLKELIITRGDCLYYPVFCCKCARLFEEPNVKVKEQQEQVWQVVQKKPKSDNKCEIFVLKVANGKTIFVDQQRNGHDQYFEGLKNWDSVPQCARICCECFGKVEKRKVESTDIAWR